MKLSKMNINKWFLTLAILVYSIAGFSQTTVDLSLHQPGAAPSGSPFEWHSATPASAANIVSIVAAKTASAGTYYGAFYDLGSDCYSPESKVDVVIGSCGASSVDISSYATGTAQWYDNSGHTGSAITASAAPAGTYFPFEVAGGVYTPIDQVVIVSLNALPTAYAVSGTGSYCSGGTGLAVGLVNSTSGVNYQLQIGGANTGALVAGTGSAISFGLKTAAGTYTVIATNATTTCTVAMTGNAIITVNPLPTDYAVTGAGSYCTGGTGLAVGLANSTSGVNYQLQIGGANTGALVAGTGLAISFGLQTAGTYTVIATNATTTCTVAMTGNAIITVNPLPTAYAVSGTGSYCSGGTGVAVGLVNSTSGVNYQLQIGGANTGALVAGTGSAISFGLQTAGTYTVVATNATTTCTVAMTGNAIITINSLPTAYAVSGTGSYCIGGTGLAVGLVNSTSGVNYQLQIGGTNTGALVSGTGSAISFGLKTAAGTYTVTATNATTTCTVAMTGSAVITVNPLPTATITSTTPTTFCAGGSVVLTANGGTSYLWSTAETTQTITVTTTSSPTVQVTNDNGCQSAASAPTAVTVNPSLLTSVSISATSYEICSGTSVIFTATPINGGTAPAYQWYNGATTIPGETAATYTSTTLADGDAITVQVTSNAICATGSPATSNSINMVVGSEVNASVSLSASSNPICSGTSVTFTATPTNGGSAPIYKWFSGGIELSSETASTYTPTSLANNEVIKVEMTSNENCVKTNQITTESSVTMEVNALPATATIAASGSTAICAGSDVTLTSSASSGNQWYKDGVLITGATSTTYSAATIGSYTVIQTTELVQV